MMRQSVAALALVAAVVAPASSQETGAVVSEAVVHAPVRAVWTAWTTSDGLRAWLAPHTEIELRIGGLMRTNYHQQGTLGDPKTIENTILSFEPERMLSMRVTKYPDDFPFPNAIRDMWTVIYLDSAGEGRTRVRVVSLGFRAEEESQRMRAFFVRGNAVTLQQLQSRFSGASR